jgi:hypothetical protein
MNSTIHLFVQCVNHSIVVNFDTKVSSSLPKEMTRGDSRFVNLEEIL